MINRPQFYIVCFQYEVLGLMTHIQVDHVDDAGVGKFFCTTVWSAIYYERAENISGRNGLSPNIHEAL